MFSGVQPTEAAVQKDEFLGVRKHTLEEAFFKKLEAQKLAKLRAELARAATREELEAATGVRDPAALDALVALGISGETLTALSIVPLVHVAWADGSVQDAERDAILAAAKQRGITDDSPGHALLSEWLNHDPEPALFEAWSAYTQALASTMAEATRDSLRDEVVAFARSVAEAAGGFLGIRTISAAEDQALGGIARAFTPHG
jgi:hypothetical protein